MGPLYGGEATAAVALGLTVANLGRSTVLPASEPVAMSAEGCEFVEQLLPRVELQEHRGCRRCGSITCPHCTLIALQVQGSLVDRRPWNIHDIYSIAQSRERLYSTGTFIAFCNFQSEGTY